VLQYEYWHCVGKLLFGMQKAWPQVCNCVRDLSGFFDHPTKLHWAEAWQVVQYLHQHQDKILQSTTQTEMRVCVYVDASFAPPSDSWHSIAGMLVTVGGSLVQWVSKAKGPVALLSSKAEYMSMCAQ